MEDFQTHYDGVVTGTGLTQAIVAASMARVGKTVFHCDQNQHYSQEWQSMNFSQMVNWCHLMSDPPPLSTPTDPDLHLLQTQEIFRNCFRTDFITNVSQISYLCDTESDDITADTSNELVEPQVNEEVPPEPAQVEMGQQEVEVPHQPENPEQQPADEPHIDPVPAPEESHEKKWSLFKFNLESRKFNLDLTPRLLYSRGSMVDLLVQSNISRYAEFKAVTRILTIIDDNIVEVPVSRGDIFNNKDVSVIDKRMLMKFMTFCAEYDKRHEEYEKFENLPIREFLNSQNLSSVLQKFILNAIAMTTDDCPTKDALKLIKNFIHSAGRFGNTPFLFTLYGTGELPQAFCRLCAVFGGTYCLKKKCESFIVDSTSNKCNAVVIDGRRFNCDFVVTDYTSVNSEATKKQEDENKYISRAILITDQSIKKSDSEHLSLLHIPKSEYNQSSVFLIEVGHSALVAPKGLYIQYLWCDSHADNAKQDLMPIVKRLYNFTPEAIADKPKVLWSVYYNQQCNKQKDDNLPENIKTTTPPINELDFDFAIEEARTIFTSMYPNEEFLPRAPDPNEIIFEGQPNNDIEMMEPNNQAPPLLDPVINNENNVNN